MCIKSCTGHSTQATAQKQQHTGNRARAIADQHRQRPVAPCGAGPGGPRPRAGRCRAPSSSVNMVHMTCNSTHATAHMQQHTCTVVLSPPCGAGALVAPAATGGSLSGPRRQIHVNSNPYPISHVHPHIHIHISQRDPNMYMSASLLVAASSVVLLT